MEYLIFAAAALLIILVLMFANAGHKKKDRQTRKEKLRTGFGQLPQKAYKSERLKSIARYYQKHPKSYQIDDITWNDLNMDEIFPLLDHTLSAAGEEYLYYMLRSPLFEKEALDKREEIIAYFAEQEEARLDCQMILSQMGGTGNFSLYDYLDYLDGLGERKNGKHYLVILAVGLCIPFFFLYLPVGILLLFLTVSVNIIAYFKEKNEIDPYITSFAYILRMLHAAKEMTAVSATVLNEKQEVIAGQLQTLSSVKTNAYLLMSPNRMNFSSDILEMLLDYLRMIFHLDLMKFNQMLQVITAHKQNIDRLVTELGEIDSLIAAASYRAQVGVYCLPVFTGETALYEKQVYHPLLQHPVKNDIELRRGILITGSNASGKSTFLKTLAVNALFAQTIHTCLAEEYRTGFFKIYSSMSLRDDIQGGDSYYMVEIKALKRMVLEASKGDIPLLCFADEILRGTNTVERIAAAAQILKSMAMQQVICCAATHDIELTSLLSFLYDNYHFEETIEDNDISFSYKLLSGPSSTRNAIKLLAIMGYEQEIVEKAGDIATKFLENHTWSW